VTLIVKNKKLAAIHYDIEINKTKVIKAFLFTGKQLLKQSLQFHPYAMSSIQQLSAICEWQLCWTYGIRDQLSSVWPTGVSCSCCGIMWFPICV